MSRTFSVPNSALHFCWIRFDFGSVFNVNWCRRGEKFLINVCIFSQKCVPLQGASRARAEGQNRWDSPCELSTSRIFLNLGFPPFERSTLLVYFFSQISYHNNLNKLTSRSWMLIKLYKNMIILFLNFKHFLKSNK